MFLDIFSILQEKLHSLFVDLSACFTIQTQFKGSFIEVLYK